MGTFDDKVKQITTRINLILPTVDTSQAGFLRPIIDSFAEISTQADMAESRQFTTDVSMKSGKDLDDFCANFGFTRIPATNATGFITIRVSGNISKDYVIEAGTRVWGKRPNGTTLEYLVAMRTAIPRYSSVIPVPVVADRAGASQNAKAGELRNIDFTIDSMLWVVNEVETSGGSAEENDVDFRTRYTATLFRSIASTEAYYTSIARRHPSVAGVQLIKPQQVTEEHLKIRRGEAQSQEDSLVYTFPNEFAVFNVRTKEWLEERRDFEVYVDNETPTPPLFRFLPGGEWRENDDVLVRFSYCSSRSRNDPKSNTMHYLDMYLAGNDPMPIYDYSFWPMENEVGSGSVTEGSHPGGNDGDRYYVFARQPVVSLHPEMQINGRTYVEGRDYYLLKDRSQFADSTRARDAICWKKGALPSQRPGERGTNAEPGFHIPYFHESVISEVQEVLDDPQVKGATDDVLCHSASRTVLDMELIIEWESGNSREARLRNNIQTHLATIPMGSKVRVGNLMKQVTNTIGVASATLVAIRPKDPIRGRLLYKSDVPLVDGAIPLLGDLTVKTTAPNVFDEE